jgi:glyoxylase-like metal-dependent hydrolase (beta-lactamase superfamily II)
LIIVDGGPKSVYKPHLKPRLEQIRIARGLSNQDSLPIDLLMVSHVDDDHIQGILDLTKELVESQDAQKPQLVQVLSFWHNSFDDIIGKRPEELTAAFRSHFGAAATSGELPADATLEVDDESELTEDVNVTSRQHRARLGAVWA